MTSILGVSAFYHDSAAALLVDGKIVAAAQEERFSRRKHDAAFPAKAVGYCLGYAGLKPEQLDYVGFYEKPLAKFDRWLNSIARYVPSGYRAFRQAVPSWVKEKLLIPREFRNALGFDCRERMVFVEHHESHAASAFFPSPFEQAAILTIDGVGEWATTCLGRGSGRKIELIDELRFPHSLGLLYAAFTYYCGFRINGGEYKLMGLAPFGQPVYREAILRHLIDLQEDGSFHLDMRYFNFVHGLTMTSAKFERLFGGKPRDREAELTQRVKDLAASIQSVTEEVMLRTARQAYRKVESKNLVLAGGVALNCVANGRVMRESPFERIWIQPSAGDAGGALGTACFIWHQLLEKPRNVERLDAQQGSLLGPSFTDDEIDRSISENGVVAQTIESDDELCRRTAKLLAQGRVVGWFQGRMEYGPRALGNRSILGDPRDPNMQSQMNLKIKFREAFRPFAPIVLAEYVDTYFDVPKGFESPYMLIVANVREEFRRAFPAVTHVDGTARIQTVDAERRPLLHRLLSSFYRETGSPILVNTSFNVRGEPLVCLPSQAIHGFMMTDMDVLILGKRILLKSEQRELRTEFDRENFRRGYREAD